MMLCDGSLVLTLFVRALGGSNLLVGLLPSLKFFGWLMPQFFAAGNLQRLTKFLPAVQRLEAVRSAFYLLIGLCALVFAQDHPEWVLLIFFILFLSTRIAAGSSNVARAEIVARIYEEAPYLLAAPARRLGMAPASIPVSKVLEEELLPWKNDIKATVLSMLK